MTTPTGPISLGAVQTEFGGSNPISMSEYYRGGSLVNTSTAAGTSGVQIATSGAIRLGDFRGVSSIVFTTSFSAALSNTAFTTGIRSASVTLASNGNVSYSNGSGPSNWVNVAPTTGIGNSYWMRVNVSNVTNTAYTNISPGTWYQLSLDRTFAVQNTGTALEGTGDFTISIATDSGGSNIVATLGTGGWSVGYIV